LLRNSRTIGIPSVTQAARRCIQSGAQGITVHPRPDQRHIRFSDVPEILAVVREHPTIEYNIEGNPFIGMMDIVRAMKPDQCTLVPDDSTQFTSDHGWDAARDGERLRPIIDELRDMGVRVSLFMDPDLAQIEQIAKLQPDRIELYTEPYAAAFGTPQQEDRWQQYAQAAQCAQALGLGVNAGHDLNLSNLPRFVAIPGILECSIGHALIADALEYGLSTTIDKYLQALQGQR
jgi:pyridoxine 5-phosphate synthase